MYTYERKVTYSDLSWNGHVDEAQIVRYFQDCSTMQSDALGMGIDFLQQHSHVWMLTSWQILFYRKPELGENIQTATWAYGFDAMYGYRNFTLKDCNSELLAAANSVWVLINTKTGRPERLTSEFVEGYGCEEKFPMDYAPRHIKLPKMWENMQSFEVTKADLDTNCHVNNARYIAMALEYVKDTDHMIQIRAEYKKAAVYKDKIYPRIHRDDDRLTVALCDQEGHIFVVVECLFV